MSKQPILFDGDESNLYVYAGNDPIDGVDPTGTATVINLSGVPVYTSYTSPSDVPAVRLAVSTLLAITVIAASALWCSGLQVVVLGTSALLILFFLAMRWRSVAPLGAAALVLSVVLSHWPLRVTFAMARPQLEALADALREQRTVQTSIQFHDVSTEINAVGWPMIWVGNSASGRRGFARGEEVRKRLDIAYVGFSVLLPDEWVFLSEE